MIDQGGIATLTRPPSCFEIDQLESHVQAQLHGRVRQLRLKRRGDGLILSGEARTYYAKQLAQHAVMDATEFPILANEIEVC
jgi:hypothetical protein